MTNDEVLFLCGQVAGLLARPTEEELATALQTPGLVPGNRRLVALVVEFRNLLDLVMANPEIDILGLLRKERERRTHAP